LNGRGIGIYGPFFSFRLIRTRADRYMSMSETQRKRSDDHSAPRSPGSRFCVSFIRYSSAGLPCGGPILRLPRRACEPKVECLLNRSELGTWRSLICGPSEVISPGPACVLVRFQAHLA